MVWNILMVLFFLTVPAGVLWLCRRVPFLGKIGPVLILYLIGILVGNIFHPDGMAEIQDLLSSAMVPLAIPLMLFACKFRKSETRSQLLALLTGLLAVTVAVIAGYLLFGRQMDDGAQVGGMLTGVYTGGTINLASLKVMLGVPEETFILLNSFDMAVSFLYLTFLLAVGIRLARRLLGGGPATAAGDAPEASADSRMAMAESEMYRGIFSRAHFLPTLKALGLSVLIAGIGLGLSFLITGEVNMIVLILTLTTLSIAASFLPAVHRWEKSYDAGMYLVLVFSLVVASMVDLRSLDLRTGGWLLAYIAFVIFVSLFVQLSLGRLFRLDADTSVITSVAMINSPLFVPMIAEAMKNRRVILTGITIGIVGYAAGNYLGVLVAHLLG